MIPENLAKEPHIHQAFDIANEAGMSDEELAAQERRYDFIRLQRGSIEKALQDGLEQGIEKGIEKGIQMGMEKGLEEGREIGLQEGERRMAIQSPLPC